MILRDWQQEAFSNYNQALRQGTRSLLWEAAPGAGKTNAALAVCRDQLRRRGRRRVIVVVPTRHLTAQWATAARRWHIHLHHGRDAGNWWTADYDGVAVTYQQIAQRPDYFQYHSRDTLVVLDEIHHAGDGLAWGNATRQGFAAAGFVLGLSGTPFRSDENAIPFVVYDDAGISRPDYIYSYSRAIADGICRPVAFLSYGGEVSWRDEQGTTSAAFSDGRATVISRRLRVALEPGSGWIQQMLADADRMLTDVRQEHPDAGGLVVAADQAHARGLAKTMAEIAGEMPAVALSDDPDASSHIKAFTHSPRRWLVACDMVSEGVDIPRLRVGVYATTVTTRMYFRQFIGRLARVTPQPAGVQVAYCYLPADRRLELLAAQVEAEQQHVIDLRQKLLPETGAVVGDVDAADPVRSWKPLPSKNDGLDTLIVHGQQLSLFGNAPTTPARLRHVIQERVAVRAAEPPVTRLEEAEVLREEINRLVGVYCRQFGQTFAQVYARLNQMQRVEEQSRCTHRQLQQRLALLERWVR